MNRMIFASGGSLVMSSSMPSVMSSLIGVMASWMFISLPALGGS